MINVISNNTFTMLDRNHNLGIWFYGQEIYPAMKDIPADVRSYSAKLLLHINELEYGERMYDKDYEIFEVIFTANLQEYLKVEKRIDYITDMEYDYVSFDYNKIFEHDIKQYEFLSERLKLKNQNKDSLLPKIEISDDVEFLEFDDSSYILAGPYEHNEKLGGYAKILPRHDSQVSLMSPDLFVNRISIYDFPVKYRDNLDFSTSDTARLTLKNIPYKYIIDAYNRYLRTEINDIHDEYAYQVYIYGNDDTSYSRGFHSQIECEEELEHLRSVQPINMITDIHSRDYRFTN